MLVNIHKGSPMNIIMVHVSPLKASKATSVLSSTNT